MAHIVNGGSRAIPHPAGCVTTYPSGNDNVDPSRSSSRPLFFLFFPTESPPPSSAASLSFPPFSVGIG